MKRFLTIIMTAMLSCMAIVAQGTDSTQISQPEQSVELSPSIEQPNEMLPADPAPYWKLKPNTLQISAGWISGFWNMKMLFAWIPAAVGHSRNWDYYGNYGLQYYYQLTWYCRLGGKLNWELDAYDIYKDKSDTAQKIGVTRNNTVSLVASVQFTYFNRPYVQIYSGLDVGVGAHFANTRYEKDYTGEKKQSPGVWLPAFNITPIGVGFGSWPVYGYVETNFGYEGYIKAGLGVHF